MHFGLLKAQIAICKGFSIHMPVIKCSLLVNGRNNNGVTVYYRHQIKPCQYFDEYHVPWLIEIDLNFALDPFIDHKGKTVQGLYQRYAAEPDINFYLSARVDY
jgi:hypothetical protein